LIRTVGDVRPPKNNLLNKILHVRWTDHFIFTSEANLIRYISRWAQLRNNNNVVYGGVDRDVFYKRDKMAGLLDRLSLNKDQIIVGIIGRLSEVKDHHTFIKAIALVAEGYPDVRFIISGIDAQITKDELSLFAAGLSIQDKITFLDLYQPVSDLISIFDIGVIASKGSEAICRIAMEYLAMGIPVIATDVNVVPEIISNGRNGFIINKEDPYAMAVAICQLIAKPALRQKISRQNIEDFNKYYDLQTAVKQTVQVYKHVIVSHSPGSER
jgi:glycosyltransferase involved in cell wall biosynthesis